MPLDISLQIVKVLHQLLMLNSKPSSVSEDSLLKQFCDKNTNYSLLNEILPHPL